MFLVSTQAVAHWFSFGNAVALKSYSFTKKNTLHPNHNRTYVHKHCVKNVHIWSFSGLYFPAFGLNTARYSISIRIQSKFRKYEPENIQIQTLLMQ